jgi:hypothetical protein
VAHDIALLVECNPEDEAMLDQFERWAAETLVDWPPPEVKLPGPE